MARSETLRFTVPRRTIIPPGVWTFTRGRHGSLPGPLCDWLLSRHLVTRLANKPVIIDSLLSWQLSAELFGERTGEQKYDSCTVGCRNCCFVCQLFEHAHLLLDPGDRTGRSLGGQEDRVGRVGRGGDRNGGGQERGGGRECKKGVGPEGGGREGRGRVGRGEDRERVRKGEGRKGKGRKRGGQGEGRKGEGRKGEGRKGRTGGG